MELSGGWEEITNAFMYETDLNWQKVLDYTKQLNHPATAARLGFMLERFQDTMQVPEDVLTGLSLLIPRTPEYFYRSNRKGIFVKRWNLYVPEDMLNQMKENDYEF